MEIGEETLVAKLQYGKEAGEQVNTVSNEKPPITSGEGQVNTMKNEKPPILPSGKETSQVFDPLIPPAGPAPPLEYGAPPPFQPPYPVHYGPPSVGSTEDPILQLQQTITITAIQPCNEPDHLGYSIFTMLCCFLPLGIAALVNSIQTREANRMGRTMVAKEKSRQAQKLAHSALAVGIVIIIFNIIRLVVFSDKS